VSSPRECIAWIRNEDCRFSFSLFLSSFDHSTITDRTDGNLEIKSEQQKRARGNLGLVRLTFLFRFSLNFFLSFSLSLSRSKHDYMGESPSAELNHQSLRVERRALKFATIAIRKIEISESENPWTKKESLARVGLFGNEAIFCLLQTRISEWISMIA